MRTKFDNSSFQAHDSFDGVLANLQTTSKPNEVFVTQIEGSVHKYVISVNHLTKKVTIADSLGNFWGRELRDVRSRIQTQLGNDYEITELPIVTQFAPNGCGVFCANMAVSFGRTGGDNLASDLLVLTQSGTRLRAVDDVRKFLESDTVRTAKDRTKAFDDHVQSLGLEDTYRNAHRQAIAMANDPDFRLYVAPGFRDQITAGRDLQMADLNIANMPGRWPSIKRDKEVDLRKKVDDWRNGNTPRGKDLARIEEEEGFHANFELLRRQILRANKAEQDLLLWSSYRPLAEKLPDDAALRNKVFAVQSADGQSLTFPDYIAARGDKQNLTAADQFTQFLLWLSLKADKKPGVLQRLRLRPQP